MEVSSSHQMYVFLLCIASGIACGIFFDLQRSLRKVRFAGGIRTTLEDILFVLVCVALTIALGFYFNDGQLRYYQIMGFISGALFYAAFLSRVVMRLLDAVYRFFMCVLIKPIIKLFKICSIPFKKLLRILKKLLSKAKHLGKALSRSIKTKKKQLKKRIKML